MSELEFLSQYVKWSLGLGGVSVASAFGILWYEIRGLRKVRHEDREMIARVSLDNEQLASIVQDQMKSLKDQLEDLKHENKMLKFMLKSAGKSADLEYVEK